MFDTKLIRSPAHSTEARLFSVSDDLVSKIYHLLLSQYSLSLQNDGLRIAESVLKLSDFYISNPESSTPWTETWCQIAYLGYYLPLNEIRNRAVISQGEQLGFFDNINSLYDFGSGLGSASLNLKAHKKVFIELSPIAQKIHAQLESQGLWLSHWNSKEKIVRDSLAIFSYSLTEVDQLPSWALNCDKIMITEPSTKEDGQLLLNYRKELIKNGFYIWAPCTHQMDCPLLTLSKKDWCHDRIHFEQPEWFAKIEKNLPIKNQTLTFSYLLASKSPSPVPNGLARTVGDQLKENGKTRQLVCQGPQREFLAWMHKYGEVPASPRGDLIQIPANSKVVSNEIRIMS